MKMLLITIVNQKCKPTNVGALSLFLVTEFIDAGGGLAEAGG